MSAKARRRAVMDRPKQVVAFARKLAATIPNFQSVKGPGVGDHATREFMHQLREKCISQFGEDFSEQKLCRTTAFAVDFYFPDEATIVEVALGLPNSASEFEKDVLKAVMAQDSGFVVRRLVFVSRAGAEKKCAQPGRSAVKAWALAKHRLQVEVHDLGGVPRVRARRPRARAGRTDGSAGP